MSLGQLLMFYYWRKLKMSKKRIMKSVKALLLCGVIATSSIAFAGCGTTATQVTDTNKYTEYTLKCCKGSIARKYDNKTLFVSGCKHFKCNTSNGKWSKYSNGHGIHMWTTNGAYDAYGEINGKIITICI